MTDRFILAVVILTTVILIFGVVPILVQALWHTRDLRGLARALLIKLIVADFWMVFFLGYLMVNRLWELGGLNDVILIMLAAVLFLRPITFLIWYRRWERAIRKENY